MGDLLIFQGYTQLETVNNEHSIATEIITKIRVQDRKTLSQIYEQGYPMVEKYISENSGTSDDAADIFQDAMYLLIKKTAEPGFQLNSKISTFLFGISRNLWLKELTKKRPDQKDLIGELEYDELPEEDLVQFERTKLMKRCVDLLGEPCKTIIVQFYFFQTSMKEIAEMLHYTNANNAKNQKYKCFMRLKKMILNKGADSDE